MTPGPPESITRGSLCDDDAQCSLHLLPTPAGSSLFEKSSHTFLSVFGNGVQAHYLFRVGVSLGLIEIDLGVESLLADRNGEGARLSDPLRQGIGFFAKPFRRRYAVYETPFHCGIWIDRCSSEQHLHCAFLPDRSSECHHGRRAK